MCMPAAGGGPFGPASVPPRSPAARAQTIPARRATRLTLPSSVEATSPDLTSQPGSNPAIGMQPIGRLLQLSGLSAGSASGVSRSAPVSERAGAPQSARPPLTPDLLPRSDVPGDARSDGRLILKQVAAGTLGAADAMVRFEELLSRRGVSPAKRQELNLSFGENLARAVRRRFSAHDVLRELQAKRGVATEPLRQGTNTQPEAPDVADVRSEANAQRVRAPAAKTSDHLDRGNILPLAFDRRTGKLVFALPNSVIAAVDAAKLPGDVLFGRIDPNSTEGLRRAFDLGGLVSGGPLITRARPSSLAAGARRPPKSSPGIDDQVVDIKTTKSRSSNAERGTPEFKALNDPDPNKSFRLDTGQKFSTNEFGFVQHLEFKPIPEKRGRSKLQTDVGKLGRDTDVGGHLQAARHGGPSNRFNIIRTRHESQQRRIQEIGEPDRRELR